MGHRNTRLLLWILSISLLLLILTVRGLPGNFNSLTNFTSARQNPAFESSHERSSFAAMLSLVYRGTVVLTPVMAGFGYVDVGYYHDNIYSLFPPGVAVSILPLFLLGTLVDLGQLAAYMTPVFIALITVLLLFVIATDVFSLKPKYAALSALTFLFGGVAWSYSITIYQHIFTAFFLVLILFAFHKIKSTVFNSPEFWFWIIVGSLAYALSAFFDFTNLLLFLPLIAYLFFVVQSLRPKKFLPYILISFIFFISVALPLIYNQIVFGNWTVFSNPLPIYWPDYWPKSDTVSSSITSHSSLYLAITRFNPIHIFHGLYVLIISPSFGLLFFSPIFIIGLYGFLKIFLKFFNSISRKSEKKQIRSENLVLVGIIFTSLAMYSLYDNPSGGLSFGPRYLIPTMACLALLISQFISENPQSLIRKNCVFILFLISSAISLLGAVTTNIVPELPVGVMYNLKALIQNRSGSFIYNTFLSHFMPLSVYFIILYLILIFSFTLVLFSTQKSSKS